MTPDDGRWMSAALALGRRGLGQVWPRPAVGCVIVAEGRIVGRGVTDGQAGPHAEVVALRQAGPRAKGATAYVTLEPCAHHGRTPPCADALIDAGIARVVTALEDPFPDVAGRGHARLLAAGISVETGLMAAEAKADNSGFFKRLSHGLPVVSLKLATSIDGRIATATGESQWITGPAARRVVHGMRRCHDAVLVGGGTARADDPSLTVRGLGVTAQPVRVVASRHLDLPLDGKLAQTARDVPLWLLHGAGGDAAKVADWQARGAKVLAVPVRPGGFLEPAAALQRLAEEGITRVFCEGGGMLAGSLLQADLVDELIAFTAGIGIGAEGQPALGAMGVDRLAGAPRFALRELRAVGGDVLHRWARQP